MSYQGKYDPSDFNVPPEHKGGHSQKVQANIQSGHYRAIEQIIRSGVFPFNGGVQDFVRWAIREGLLIIESKEPHLINSVMKRSNMMTYALQEETMEAEHLKWLDTLRETVQKHLGRGDTDMAQMTVDRCWQECQKMPDEPPRQYIWKMKYINTMKKHFADLLPAGVMEVQ